MISKKNFLDKVRMLNELFPASAINDTQALIYYEVMSPDFTDDQFDKALNFALKNSFKFPPIAAFYKPDPSQPEVKKAYDPPTAAEAAAIHKVREKYDL